jgi:tetratricopeptide (TPR) repeat protein
MASTRKLAVQLLFALLPSFITVGDTVAQNKNSMSPDLIYSRSKGSIVTVLTFDPNKAPLSQGSGFIVARNRIVTNYHVVAGSASASVVFDDGTMVGTSSLTAGSGPKDLVILDANTGNRPPLPLGNELEVKVGQSVYAIGTPQGLSASLSSGLVSAFRQDEGQFLIQITASIAPGSSGGPLFDQEGHVIGITTSRLKDGSFGFAVGVDDLQHLLKVPLPVPLKLSDLQEETPASNDSLTTAQALFDQKKYAEVAEVVRNLPDSTKNSYEAQLLLCKIGNELHDQLAIQNCDAAIHLHPTDGTPYKLKAFVLLSSRDLEQAEASALKAVQLSNDDDAKQILGLIYYWQEKYSLVPKQLSETSNDLFVLTLLEGAELRVGDKGAYQRLSARINALKGANNGWQLYAEGRAAERELKFDVASEDYRKCDADSDFVDPICGIALANVEFALGSRMQAETHIMSSVEHYSFSSSALAEAIFIELAMGNLNRAKELHSRFQNMSSSLTDSTDCLYYYGANQPSLAQLHCAAAVTADENSGTAWSNAGYVALDMGQFATALTDFAKAQKIYSGSTQKHTVTEELDLTWGFLLAAYFTGDRKDSKEIYRQTKKNYPDFSTTAALKQLPLVWSDQTLSLINKAMADFK